MRYLVFLALAITLSFGVSVLAQPALSAIDAQDKFCEGIGGRGSGEGCGGVDSNDAPTDFGVLVRTTFNVIAFVAGLVAVIMVIIGGIKYVTSNGDNSQVTSAKSTITYAVIGLVVVLAAYAIVDFIADNF